jgi:hypothetical protein
LVFHNFCSSYLLFVVCVLFYLSVLKFPFSHFAQSFRYQLLHQQTILFRGFHVKSEETHPIEPIWQFFNGNFHIGSYSLSARVSQISSNLQFSFHLKKVARKYLTLHTTKLTSTWYGTIPTSLLYALYILSRLYMCLFRVCHISYKSLFFPLLFLSCFIPWLMLS